MTSEFLPACGKGLASSAAAAICLRPFEPFYLPANFVDKAGSATFSWGRWRFFILNRAD